MVRIGAITDAHANLPALHAALDALERSGCEMIYHTGDVVGAGPHPRECLELLLGTSRARLLMGNHDKWYACGLPRPRPHWMIAAEEAHHRWVHAQLGDGPRLLVAQWPYVLHEEVEGVRLTFVHYGLDDSLAEWVPIIRDPTPEALDAMFARFESDLLFYGHHHPASDLQGRARYLNPGSLGCHAAAEARFLVVECRGGDYTVWKDSVAYDDTELFEAFERREVPERDFIRRVFFPRSGPV